MNHGSRIPLTAALIGVGLLMAGCGSSGRQANELRPPAPIMLSASISPGAVKLSPVRVGAGPISLNVVNLTGTSQRVTFESALTTAAGVVRQQTGPINPQDTATLKANLKPGLYRLRVAGDSVKPATLRVGPKRPSSQNDLMLP